MHLHFAQMYLQTLLGLCYVKTHSHLKSFHLNLIRLNLNYCYYLLLVAFPLIIFFYSTSWLLIFPRNYNLIRDLPIFKERLHLLHPLLELAYAQASAIHLHLHNRLIDATHLAGSFFLYLEKLLAQNLTVSAQSACILNLICMTKTCL